jgi:protein phosphatase
MTTLSENVLYILIGPSGCGKSTWARAHFLETEVISSDRCRAWVADDEADQSATADAFAVLRLIVALRLKRGRRTVIDATNIEPWSRAQWIGLAKEAGTPTIAVVFDVPESVCQQRNAERTRVVPPAVIAAQYTAFTDGLQSLDGEGFAEIQRVT